jgi:hypothetical protein
VLISLTFLLLFRLKNNSDEHNTHFFKTKNQMKIRKLFIVFTVFISVCVFSTGITFSHNVPGKNRYKHFIESKIDNIYEVSKKGHWTTIPEIIAFLEMHMTGPAVVRLGSESYSVSFTQVIDLPYDITFEGFSYGSTKIEASAGLEGKPMFKCISDCWFKTIAFNAATLKGYGTNPGEDAIHLTGNGTYHEIMDCTFDHFYNAILDSSDAELWLFQCDVSHAHQNGVLIHGDMPGVKVRVSQTDFINCRRGINMDKGSKAIVQINLGTYYNENKTDSAIIYNSCDFSFSTMIITNNAWNNIGELITGFDFTRTDLRDWYAYIESNAGYANEKPHSKVNVLSNTSTTTVIKSGTWVKASFTGTNNYVVGFDLNGNKLTYTAQKKYNGVMNISGNILCSNDSTIFSVAVVKNGNIDHRLGEKTVIDMPGNKSFQWFTTIFLESMTKDDYYEIWITSSSDNDVYTLQDVQWFCNTF